MSEQPRDDREPTFAEEQQEYADELARAAHPGGTLSEVVGPAVDALPGLARIAASAWLHTTEWGLRTGARAAGRMARADLQLDHSLSALGTVYSQMLLIGSKDVDSDRADRLRDDIRGQGLALQDIVESLTEVYGNAGAAADLPAAVPSARKQSAAGR